MVPSTRARLLVLPETRRLLSDAEGTIGILSCAMLLRLGFGMFGTEIVYDATRTQWETGTYKEEHLRVASYPMVPCKSYEISGTDVSIQQSYAMRSAVLRCRQYLVLSYESLRLVLAIRAAKSNAVMIQTALERRFVDFESGG